MADPSTLTYTCTPALRHTGWSHVLVWNFPLPAAAAASSSLKYTSHPTPTSNPEALEIALTCTYSLLAKYSPKTRHHRHGE